MTASCTGASSFPACASTPASVASEMSAPCRARPAVSECRLRPATYRSVNSSARNPLLNRPLPIAFGGPGAITVTGTEHRHVRRYRRRRCTTSRTLTCQSICSMMWSPRLANAVPHRWQQ
jgi:hypothetical protein